jgi:hypothetical protein
MPTFVHARVGDRIGHEALSVFPLFAEPGGGSKYLLADEAIGTGGVKVEEVGESGSVPNLLVDNQADTLVLFLEGEELRGAKQNRVLNMSLLAPAKSRTTIPVSCVEQGRWRYVSRHFGSSGRHSSSKLRHILRKSVTQTVKDSGEHGSDQRQVWMEVERQMVSLGSHSVTGAMSDTYESYDNKLAEFRERLKYVEGATGLAVAVGNKVVSVDVFDKPATCQKVWDRLMTGMIMDALEPGEQAATAGTEDVQKMLTALENAPWQEAPTVGAGQEFRAEIEGDRHAMALVLNGSVVHGSIVMGA